MEKLNVCVIFGGTSVEHKISTWSACNIVKNLDRKKYNVSLIGITKNGRWLYCKDKPEDIISGKWEENGKHEAIVSPSTSSEGIIKFLGTKIEKIKIDVFFPIIHGKHGEDGALQGLFEMQGIPYVGCSTISSSICMDKAVTKILLKNANIVQTDWVQVKEKQKIDYDLIEKKIGYPNFVKPANSGSSLGINKTKNKEELISNIKTAFEYDSKVIIEKSIEDAREIECGVIGNESPIVSTTLGEIISCNVFYDYEAKYEKESELKAPIILNEKISEAIKENALLAYKVCECRGMARIDFLLDEDKVYLNEINTIPGFTDKSMFPRLWKKDGLEISKLLDKLIEFALK